MNEPIRLTQYSHGAGCGCKISPKVLDVILAGSGARLLAPEGQRKPYLAGGLLAQPDAVLAQI